MGAGLSFDSLLTWQEGLVIVIFFVTPPFGKQTYFRQDIWFNIDGLQSTKLVKDMSIEKLLTTTGALFSQQTLSKRDSSLVTSLLAAPKSTPSRNQVLGDLR